MPGSIHSLGRGRHDRPADGARAADSASVVVPKTRRPDAAEFTSPERTPAATSIADLSRLVVERRAELEARAFRILGDSHEAADVVQEAFLKVVLAAPELASTEQVVAYLRTTVTNLALNTLRAAGRRPALVAIGPDDSPDTLEQFDTLAAYDADLAGSLERAQDAGLIRDALSRLSPSHRQALLLWDAHGASTDEVAAALGIKPSAVRSLVYRARAAMRHTLESTVVDAERGLTAADLLNTSIARAASAAKTAGKAALALMLPLLAGIAWWFGGASSAQQEQVALPAPSTSESASPEASASETADAAGADATTLDSTTSAPTPIPADATANPGATDITTLNAALDRVAIALTRINAVAADYADKVVWPGTNAAGIPSGVWISDGVTTGQAAVANVETDVTLDGRLRTTSDVITVSTGAALLLGQQIVVDATTGEVDYVMSPSVRVNGEWLDLRIASQDVQITRLPNRELLITVWAIPNTRAAAAEYGLAAGTDLASVPAAIGVRIHTTEIGQPIYGQSVVLIDLKAGS